MRPRNLERELQTPTRNTLTATARIDHACQRGPTVDVDLYVNECSSGPVHNRNIELAMNRPFL